MRIVDMFNEKSIKFYVWWSIDYIEKQCKHENIPCSERYQEFLSFLAEYINGLDSDLKEYSSSKLKIIMNLNGFDDDDVHRFLLRLQLECVDRRIGVIDMMKPIELGNVYVSLLEF